MTVVVRLGPVPRWWMWRPGVDRAAAVRAAGRRARWARARLLATVAVPLAGVLAVLAPTALWAVVPVVCAGAVLLLPQRVPEWDVVLAARDGEVVHSEQFADLDQRRRARRMCEHFLAVRGMSDSPRLGNVETLLWQALVALRDSLAVREAFKRADNRPGLAAELAEPTRRLAELDRKVDEFADALRIAVEESDPELAASALRRVAALDPI